MNINRVKLTAVLFVLFFGGFFFITPEISSNNSSELDEHLRDVLNKHGFTGRIEQQLEARLGRRVDNQLADLGRLAFHDTILGLNNDNSCSGCHAAPIGFGDTQSIAMRPEQQHRRAGPRGPAQPATCADGLEQRLLSPADVELTLFFAVGRPFR